MTKRLIEVIPTVRVDALTGEETNGEDLVYELRREDGSYLGRLEISDIGLLDFETQFCK